MRLPRRLDSRSLPPPRFSYPPTRHSLPATPSPKGFTLIELLIVIAIVAILATVVVLVLNPAQQLKQSRDSQRLSELATLVKAISAFQADQSGTSLGTASTTYVSVPDSDSGCANLGLPSQPPGWSYKCATSANYRKTDGTGWIPLDFTSATFKSPIGQLPVDPLNTTSTRSYYTYVTDGTKYQLAVVLESAKYAASGVTDGGQDPASYETGTTLTLAPFTHGLVGYWNFDEGTGTSAADGSGYGDNGDLCSSGTCPGATPPAWISGKFGGGLSFDGSTNYVSVSSSEALNPVNSITVSFWMRQAVVNSGRYMLYKVAQYAMGDGSTSFNLSIWNSSGARTNSGSTPYPTGQWAFVAMTSNRSSAQAYLNGLQTTSVSFPYNIATSSNNLGIGSYIPSPASYGFNGYIDDVRVYNRALTAAEISAIYNAAR